MSRLTSLKLLGSVGLALLSVLGLWLGLTCLSGQCQGRAVADAASGTGAQMSPAAPAAASLHNPTFDNHIWYEFDLRYQRAYPSGSWLPDDDTPGGPQDWRLWFLDGTAVVESDVEKKYAHAVEGIQMRPYDWSKDADQVAGVYQVVYNTTPGYFYEFQIYGQSRPEDNNDPRNASMKVGIDQVGWHPNSSSDPAVHGDFPDTTVWGFAQNYQWEYGPLTVTVQALGDHITVFTYADAPGGRYHRILWDTGSFYEVGPELIPDPDNPPAPSGITNLNVTPGRTTAAMSWQSPGPSMGQIYYRLLSRPHTPITTTVPVSYTVYMPYVSRESTPNEWQSTTLEPTYTRTHSDVITGLEPGGTYEFIVASHGHGQYPLATWVSAKSTFVTSQ